MSDRRADALQATINESGRLRDNSSFQKQARFLISDAALCTPEGQPRSPMSVDRTKSALRSFIAFCEESGWMRENPARLVRSSPATPKEPTTLVIPVMLLGLIVAWKWEVLGAILILGGYACSAVMAPAVLRSWPYALCLLAGVLFLFSSIMQRRASTRD